MTVSQWRMASSMTSRAAAIWAPNALKSARLIQEITAISARSSSTSSAGRCEPRLGSERLDRGPPDAGRPVDAEIRDLTKLWTDMGLSGGEVGSAIPGRDIDP